MIDMKRWLGVVHRGLAWPLAVCRERARWRRTAPGAEGPRLYYGYRRVLEAGEPAAGGLVKCQDLLGPFPNTPERPNLLYLVSSALPPNVRVMVRMAQRYGARVVLNQNGVAYPAWHGAGWRAANRTPAWVYHRADHVLIQSQFCRESAERFLGVRRGPSEILYNAVDVRVFAPVDAAPSEAGPVLLLAGSHHFWYRVAVAVDTLARLVPRFPGVRLVVAGRCRWRVREQEALTELRRYAGEQGVSNRLTLRGAYTQCEAPELYRSADVLLHTNYNDACPRVVLEAMACGCPVVYSATGGVPELVGEEAGIGVPGPRDWDKPHPPPPDRLAESVTQVMQQHDALRQAARRRAEQHFDVGPWVAKHSAVFQELLGKTSRGPAGAGVPCIDPQHPG